MKKKKATTKKKAPKKAPVKKSPITIIDDFQKERALAVYHEMIRNILINLNCQEAAALAAFKDALRDPVLMPYLKDSEKKIGELFTDKKIYAELAADKRVLKMMETQYLADILDEIMRDEGRH